MTAGAGCPPVAVGVDGAPRRRAKGARGGGINAQMARGPAFVHLCALPLSRVPRPAPAL